MKKKYLTLKQLRSVARKVGVKNTGKMSRVTLISKLDEVATQYMSNTDVSIRVFSSIDKKKPKQSTQNSMPLKTRSSKKVKGRQINLEIQKEDLMCQNPGDKIPRGKESTKAVLPSIRELIAAEEDEIKKHYYKESKLTIEGFGNKTTLYNSGKGDCFFIAIQQGLHALRMVEFDNDEIRQNLSLWFQDDNNAAAITKLLGAEPSDIIPYLDFVGGVKPKEGWTKYLRGRDWKFWGKRIAKKGTWVGAIELEAMNELLLNAGYDVRVNIYSSSYKKLFGKSQNIPGQIVIILYLSDGHFELLYPVTKSP